MANPQTSPISQLLNSLGITREDLNKRSDQMRQFLTADSAIPSRVPSSQLSSSSASESRALSRSSSSAAPFTRQLSRASSISTRDASPTPSTTPVKSEPAEETLPPRQFDNMEMVLERQRLNRKQKRSKKREQEQREQDFPTWTTLPQPGSSAPVDASSDGTAQSSSAHLRDNSREIDDSSHSAAIKPPPVTPMRSKYYREHTSHIGPEGPVIKAESPSPAHNPNRASAPTYPYPYYYYSAYASQSQFLTLPFRSAQASSSASKTPVKGSRSQDSPSPTKSPLPPSSPPDASSPASSPARRLVNVVSSPGPMDELEDEAKPLPYTLPPGPYSDQRPQYSYAALIGQAILSSQDHRLTLQEIYEWIVTVYPHYKRGERTWMNSIRHVLSTTVHFRKISRERSAGRSHWAIFDEDLECFVDKGYRKPGSIPKRSAGVARPRPKKRPAEEVEEEETSPSASAQKAAKRSKQTATLTSPSAPLPSSLPPISSERPPFLLPALVHPDGKPMNSRPASHHQTYYESCISAPPAFVPSGIIFPPLPTDTPSRLIATNISSPAPSAPARDGYDVESEEETGGARPSSPVASTSTPEVVSRSTRLSSPSSASVPALTPNNSSSSPIPSSDLDTQSSREKVNKGKMREDLAHFNVTVTVTGVDDTNPAGGVDGDERVFGGTLLRPVQFWDESSPSAGDSSDALQPGIELQQYATQDESGDDEDDVPLMLLSQANKLEKQRTATVKLKARPLVKMPTSPTLHRRKTATAARTGTKAGKRKTAKPTKTLSSATPSTPPRNNNRRKLQFSPVHGTLAKGIHTSPSTSLAHYKSHLEPPPALVYGGSKRRSREEDGFEDDDGPSELMRTPSRKRNTAASSAHPITPKRLLFQTDSSSPFRTPGGGPLNASPFRTPLGGRGGIFDPHDPSTLLDEELSSLGAAGRDSPAGLYGKASLYDSPNPLDGSPGKWARWW